jgi:hypothetical protein
MDSFYPLRRKWNQMGIKLQNITSVRPKNTSFEKISDEKFHPGNNFCNEQEKYIYKIDSANRNY